MPHPNKYLLLELDIAIKKIPPTLLELQSEAKAKLKEFEADETSSEDSILNYLAEVGRKEFPHRHALIELHEKYGRGVEDKMVIEHLDSNVAQKVQAMLDSGVGLEELMRSSWFEEKLDAAERYQVEDGILLARYKIEKEDNGLISGHKDEFDKLVSKWEAEAKKIEALLEQLEALSSKDVRYSDEIKDQVKQFRAGWSIVERDPKPEDVRGAIEYWNGIFEDDASAGSAK